MDFVRGKEIYDHLEQVIDRFDDVCNGIQGVSSLSTPEEQQKRWELDASCLQPVVGLVLALVFNVLTNGLHDAADWIATIVSTRVLPPRAAVLWAAFFNFIAFLFFGLHVAQTIGIGIIWGRLVRA